MSHIPAKSAVLPHVSVIIVVKNDPGLRETLELLEPQTHEVSSEVIVVDASDAGQLEAVRKDFPAVRWDHFDQAGRRLTIPHQRNRGIELARGEIIVFLDSSCQPEPEWLTSIVAAIDDGEDIVCGPVRDTNANLVRYIPGREVRSHVRECTTVSVGMRKAVAQRVEGFDETLAYGEDVDFFWRASDAGYKICSDPAVAISHHWGDTNEQLRRAFRYGRARAYLHKKHLSRRWRQLLFHEPHVWVYPVFIMGLPLTLWLPFYPLLLLVPALKNRSWKLILHHLVFGWGCLMGALTPRRAVR
jgi:GT2 family glycosyltransferase